MCSRRADVFKLWVALQRYGVDALGELHDYFCDLTQRVLREDRRSAPDFEAMHEPESNILCFRYVGDGTHADEALDQINRELRERYNLSGEGWITATNLDGRRVLARDDDESAHDAGATSATFSTDWRDGGRGRS